MKKITKYFCIILAFMSKLALYSMDNSNDNVQIIKGASYYQNIGGGITIEHGSNGVRKVYNKPQAWFMSGGEVLKKIEYDVFDVKQQEIFNKMIDPSIKYQKPTAIGIGSHIQIGRTIFYYDKNGCCVDYHRYDGPVDIKKAENYPHTIKPHWLLSDVETVTEYSCLIPFLKLWTVPQTPFTYPKRKIIYTKDGKTIDSVTRQHRIVRAVEVGLQLSALYGIYYLGKKTFFG
ncbi:hypothetical protein HYX58_01170 [Candidatus Dependentiae bacterium]|nr:hypothetical protein [Candidatus Dependentiae bacterium]